MGCDARPKNTPNEIVEYLNAKTREALKTKNVQDRYAAVAIEQLDLSAAETQAFMDRQTKSWKALIEQTAARRRTPRVSKGVPG